ncbi:DUF2523 domain-containing protein [Vibrio parahaemolyticus]|uniref:DUF2523 domain-containing protein n=1 Tax=Vibrio parahaemolyticus TaxID=670 RepID=UPI001D265BED|nr:DUF2523 domain-containing protein [Vibrio parahaemolyticus]EGR2856624.1 DUF2523 domain-containing protein [Vibrio parahaemolyticus]EGR3066471.1 hypothetical protein [Vibrio parahaemolyticus]EGR3140595.1 hypothetical protein [Vibrio parahaemolyticus]EHK0045716.1 DUF2523 domain-containing protein [Vibrio parahaemolyticus]EHZ2728034.1 DUF2523 domain-containing protein [Vibrio parahaemolyticus]
MPYIIAFFASVIVPLIPSVLRTIATYFAVSVGFGLVAYTGVNTFLDMLADYIQANISGITGKLAQLMALGAVDTCVNVILSCLVFSFTLNGLMGATGYRPSWRKPSDPSSL